ncbi:MAG: helix-turn-helix domain-containing protein [Bacteroidota bacterium]
MKETTSILSHFGLVVKELRRKKQLSQEELANRCSLHRTYITDIEHGTRNVSLKNISKIAHALGESLHDVFASVERYAHPNAYGSRLTTSMQSPIKLLLIESDQRFAGQAVEELQRGAIDNALYVVRSGEEAIKFLFPAKTEENKNTNIPNVILLDVHPPNISGLEVLERIRKEKTTKDIPVVVMTSSAADTEKEPYRILGVEEYLTKPLNIESLTAVMHRLGFRSLFLERESVLRI